MVPGWGNQQRSDANHHRCHSLTLYAASNNTEHHQSSSGRSPNMMDRMQVIRSLQASFYKSPSDSDRTPLLDLASGKFYNLPLWRVPWSEVPGRTNILNVHEGMYTNMFETVLHTPPPWYVGHLYLPKKEEARDNNNDDDDGRRSIRSSSASTARTNADKKKSQELCSWDAKASPENPNRNHEEESAVVGTILRIADYRRMADGRLLLLVQAMERFVVDEVQQEVPYSVAHVQIIPDTEEIEESDWRQHRTEGDVAAARALAVQESFERWHRYEHENTVLPLPMDSDLEPGQVAGSALAKVLPYSPFSSVVQVPKLRSEALKDPTTIDNSIFKQNKVFTEKRSSKLNADDSQCTLEERLVQGNILQDPWLDPELMKLSMDELEHKLWLALNDFLKETRTPVSPILLGLLPLKHKWPRNFLLERIADTIEKQTKLDHKYVRVSAEYPALRRQKRLSYSAAALLEDLETVTPWRHQLLAIPSTKDRLVFVLQRFMAENGAFQ